MPGLLDLKLVPERHNAVKVLLFLDVGGSMDDHVRVCEELFSAARAEFKHLEYFYFHNFLYERLWKDNRRRQQSDVPTCRGAAHLRPDYKRDLRRRRHDEPLRDRPAGRQRRALERGGRAGMAPAAVADLCRSIWLNPAPQNYWGYTRARASSSG